MTFAALFDTHAEFYRDHYVPFLIAEGFIDGASPLSSDFVNGVDMKKPTEAAKADGSDRWPASLRRLLSEVGSCVVHFPTAEGPAPIFVMDPKDIVGWSGAGRAKSLPAYLKKAGKPATSEAVPFLTDESGAFVAYLASTSDERVFVVSDEGKHRGPVASLHEFFSIMFENARNRRMPFDGIAKAD